MSFIQSFSSVTYSCVSSKYNFLKQLLLVGQASQSFITDQNKAWSAKQAHIQKRR